MKKTLLAYALSVALGGAVITLHSCNTATAWPTEAPQIGEVQKFTEEVIGDNNLTHQRSRSKSSAYEVVYKPLTLILKQENDGTWDEATKKARLQELGDMVYFTYRINNYNSPTDIIDSLAKISSRDEVISKCAFKTERDFRLVDPSGDSLACSLFHFEPTYNLRPGLTFNLAFEVSNWEEGEYTLVFNDHILNDGTQKFLFESEEIKPLHQN